MAAHCQRTDPIDSEERIDGLSKNDCPRCYPSRQRGYEETERRRDEVADRINQIMVRRRKLERFIETVEALPELYTEFDAGQWAALVDSMTVHAKERITFTLTCGMEIEA